MSLAGAIPPSETASARVAPAAKPQRAARQISSSWRHVLTGVFLALVPGVISAYLHPWLYQTHILSPHRIELQPNSLVELARVNSLRIYVTNIETFVTPQRDWPPGTPFRDTFIIEVPPRQAGIPPEISGGTIDWLGETVSRMFSKAVDVQDARRISYEGAVSGDDVAQAGVSADLRSAVTLTKALEPIDREVPYGDVLSYAVPSDLEFARRTGTKHIFALAVRIRPLPMVGASTRGRRQPHSPVISTRSFDRRKIISLSEWLCP